MERDSDYGSGYGLLCFVAGIAMIGLFIGMFVWAVRDDSATPDCNGGQGVWLDGWYGGKKTVANSEFDLGWPLTYREPTEILHMKLGPKDHITTARIWTYSAGNKDIVLDALPGQSTQAEFYPGRSGYTESNTTPGDGVSQIYLCVSSGT